MSAMKIILAANQMISRIKKAGRIFLPASQNLLNCA